MRRIPQLILIVTTLINAWLSMQVVHELGHVLGGWLTGGEIRRIVLHPLAISRTDLGRNPQPLIVCWAGPVLGSVGPLVLWWLARWRRLACAHWLKFLAGFCLIANGAYLSVGVQERIGDAGDLLTHGSQAWMLYLVGSITIPAGFWLWNGLGPQFGWGVQADVITWRAATWSSLVLVVTVLMELAFAHHS